MRARGGLAAAGLALLALALAPDPRMLWNDTPVRRAGAWLDPSLRTPFASVLLRAPAGTALAPGERVLGVRLAGDPGLRVPGDRAALLAALGEAPAGAGATLEVRGPGGARSVPVRLDALGARRALAAQWPAALAGVLLLLFAGVCAIGGRHPVATPLVAVTGCLGGGILGALDLALPDDGGWLRLPGLRPRLAAAAWSLLPAALLHLAARFPVAMPRFRRPGLAALPWALWAAPAALAQLRFGDAAVGQAVERVALTASFLAGGILVAGCLLPGRRLTPVERFRARAATVGLALAGAGPLAAFAAGRALAPAIATSLCMGALALPAALGFAVARYRLLDPPAWLPRALLAGASASGALALAALVLHGVARAAPAARGAPALALATALLYHVVQRALACGVGRAVGARPAPEALLARAGRELAGATGAAIVLARLAAIVREDLGATAVAVGPLAADGPAPADPLRRRAIALCRDLPARAGVALARAPRAEDPGPDAPELALRLEPRGLEAVVLAVAPRADGLPYAPEEARALADAGRLATLALADALDAARLEAEVAARTAALSRALDDRTALLAAAERIQCAPDAEAVRAAVAAFLGERSGAAVASAAARPVPAPEQVVAVLCLPPAARTVLTATAPDRERAADLQPQADTLCALADVAVERLHLLAGLKREVERQAGELAAATAGRRQAEFVRRAAHELRKPGEEIRHLVAALAAELPAPLHPALERIDAAACQLGRRLDVLLGRRGARPDRRRVDLVRLVDDAISRAALLHARHYVVAHELPRLPLLGDPVRLLSLVENLLDNAVCAAGEGGRVAVRTRRGESAAGAALAVLEVEDDGPGLPPELGDEIFEPGIGGFPGGCGLGLALCREVVALHGGALAVESQPGRTVFRVELPRLAGMRS
jgi:signal transduction histidine kinase